MSQPDQQNVRLDTERLILVPILSFLLVGTGIGAWHQWNSVTLSDGSGALTAVHGALRLLFYVLMIALLLNRWRSQGARPPLRATVAAYVGTFTPFLLVFSDDSARANGGLTAVAIAVTTLGLVFSVYSLGWLGRSFGVVPQARKLVRSGPYRYVRHPLYVGELITFVGAVMTMISPFSVLVAVFFVAVQSYRALQEEKVLKAAFPDYESYMSQAGRFTPRLSALGRDRRAMAA